MGVVVIGPRGELAEVSPRGVGRGLGSKGGGLVELREEGVSFSRCRGWDAYGGAPVVGG